jgi:hypothetical protein
MADRMKPDGTALFENETKLFRKTSRVLGKRNMK